MKRISKYSKFVPYLYFIAITLYWFTIINKREGVSAYPILLFAVPFLWQIIKPNKSLNFTLGITFVCLSSYMILGSITNVFQLVTFPFTKPLLINSILFLLANFFMALWIIRNSMKRTFLN